LARKIVDSALRRLFSGLTEALSEAIMDAVREVTRGFLKRLTLALLGTFLISFGVLFLGFGLVRFLSLFLPEWLAWTNIGLFALLLGALFLLVSMPREKH